MLLSWTKKKHTENFLSTEDNNIRKRRIFMPSNIKIKVKLGCPQRYGCLLLLNGNNSNRLFVQCVPHISTGKYNYTNSCLITPYPQLYCALIFQIVGFT